MTSTTISKDQITSSYTALPSAIAVPIFDLESYKNVPSYVDQTTNRLDAWRIGVFASYTDNLVPNCCMVTFCPWVAMAQICSRIDNTACYIGTLAMCNSPYVLSGLLFMSDVMGLEGNDKAVRSESLGLISSAVALVWLWQAASVYVIRHKVRQVFHIPDEDRCKIAALVFFCSPCVLTQMTTHVQSYTPHSWSFGAPDTLPPFQYHIEMEETIQPK